MTLKIPIEMADLSKLFEYMDGEPLLDIAAIRKLFLDSDPGNRLKGSFQARNFIKTHGLSNDLFKLAVNQIKDQDNDCRWQAFIIIGEYISSRPNDIWEIIIEYGSSDDEDMRTAVATVLLEHFFEENPGLFSIKFPEMINIITHGNKNLKYTLAMCRSSFGNVKNNSEVLNFLSE